MNSPEGSQVAGGLPSAGRIPDNRVDEVISGVARAPNNVEIVPVQVEGMLSWK